MMGRYARMRSRAILFSTTKRWSTLIGALGALWFGSQFIFTLIFDQIGRITSVDAFATFFEGSTPSAVWWSLASFGVYVAILAIITRGFHQISLFSLVGPIDLARRQFVRVSLYLMPVYGLSIWASVWTPDATQQFEPGRWLLVMSPILPVLFLQISAEEFVFRGYVQGHLAALSKRPIVWMGVPSALFGLIHYDANLPQDIARDYVLWTALFGLVCADVTARSGTLGPALALHFVNNFAAILVVSTNDRLYGAALFVLNTGDVPFDPWWPEEVLVLLILWLASRLAIRR